MQVHYLLVNKVHTGFRVAVAGTFSKKLVGWMGKRIKPDEGLLLYSCNSIHTFFMRSSIDVVFLDGQNRIVKIVHAIQPWKIIAPVRTAVNVLELAAGRAQELSLKINDTLTFSEDNRTIN